MIRAVPIDDSASCAAALMASGEAGVRTGMPEAHWSHEELSGRACWENEQIGRVRHCAPRYWYLGRILILVQNAVKDGHWQAWCAEHAIQRNRWQRGRLLALAFAAPNDVAGLTVQEALALARDALRLPRRQAAAETKLRRWLATAAKGVKSRLTEFGDVTRPDGLRPHIAELMRDLAALDQACAALERNRRITQP